MRVHISLDDELVGELDVRVGKRRRSAFIAAIVARALEDERRWDDVLASAGTVAAGGHDWDEDPAAWVHETRHADAGSVG
jgi:metal-responsive CopG/Arc/MetJ family transcriptional regulator